MFSKLKKLWSFESIIGFCTSFILLFALYRIITKQSGSWYPLSFYKQLSIPSVSQISQPRKKRDSKGEIECRNVLQSIFKKPFSKARPNFLQNPVTGGVFNLELDCYCPELNLAVEYNGIQHYKYVPYFHKNKEAFYNQKYRDDMKRRICRENNVNLIEVPYSIEVSLIRNYLINELRKIGYI